MDEPEVPPLGQDTPTPGHTPQEDGPGTTTTEGGCTCCYTTAAASIAIAEASAYASAVAIATARVLVAITIAISIGILVAVLAFAWAFATAAAIAVAIAVAIAIAVAVAAALAWALSAFPPGAAGMCTVLLDLPGTASLRGPPPVVAWEVIDTLRRADHVDVRYSTDGGASFTVMPIDGTAVASNLALVGSFAWRAFTQVSAGTSVIVIVFALDAAGSEVCRSRARTILIQA